MRKNTRENESGQILIIIIILMIISLSIGIAVSNKYISGLRNITQADQSDKALAVADALVEHLLLLPVETLEEYAQNNNCGINCHLEITEPTGQVIYSDAVITVMGDSDQPYLVDLKSDQTMQVNLSGYPQNQPVLICWNGSEMSVTGTYIHGVAGNYLADAFSYNPVGSIHTDNGFSTATASNGFENCLTVITLADSQMIRIKSIYQEASVLVIPAVGASLPTQGILLESTGVAGSSIKYVSVLITDPVPPSHFDYVLYQKSTTEPLSN